MEYQNQHSQQTLREGLEEYYAVFPTLDRFEKQDARIIASAFQAHDAIHVITGMDISHKSEIILGMWQFWATYTGQDLWDSWRVILTIATNSEFSARLKDFIVTTRVEDWLKYVWVSFIPACRALANGMQMSKKWPTQDFASYLDVPLAIVREEYNLKVMDSY